MTISTDAQAICVCGAKTPEECENLTMHGGWVRCGPAFRIDWEAYAKDLEREVESMKAEREYWKALAESAEDHAMESE